MNKAAIVIIGGGLLGASVAYHLTRRGMCDVILLDRKVFRLRLSMKRGYPKTCLGSLSDLMLYGAASCV